MSIITDVDITDVRFPTGRHFDGSDAMNPDPDYSAAYVILRTDAGDGLEGHGFTFTIGEGNEIVCEAIRSLRRFVMDKDVDDLLSDMGGLARSITGDSQLRWLGPEKGVMALAAAALLNAAWDLRAKRAKKPLWRLLSDMTADEIVDLCDFRYLSDALTREEAKELLRGVEPGRAERIDDLLATGLPAYTTSAGWLGYEDEKLRALARSAVEEGWTAFKLKVGRDPEEDVRRLRIMREEIGPHARLMVDANQVWDVDRAIDWIGALAVFDLWWVEEPTSPDDVLGHAAIARAVAPLRLATGEQAQNRIIFKQLMQSEAIGFCQLDAARTTSVNEAIAIMLLAAKFKIPVCPHAGGVGLCEYVQHLSAFNYVAIAPDLSDVNVEYVDHLHEHFLDPVRIAQGRYLVPTAPGYSAQMHAESIEKYSFPGGSEWQTA